MSSLLTDLRRSTTLLAIQGAIGLSGRLSIDNQRRMAHSVAALSEALPMLRARVERNMHLALGPAIPADAPRQYFRRIGWMQGSALVAFHHGLAASPVPREASFDNSLRVVDDAIAEGRGAMIVSPHWSGHELLAGLMALRHPMTMLVRQASSPDRIARKLKWYSALGAEIILRPDGASTIKDAAAYMKVLKQGKLLAITPDLLTSSEGAVEVDVFGRRARVFGGAFAIACAARVPMLRPTLTWQSDTKVLISWTRADPPVELADRSAAVRAAAQDWFGWFERSLRAEPANWLFWLDKRWSHFLRATPHQSQLS